MAEQHAVVVTQLPPEILYSIFSINADIGEERPLETARHTSQVCSLWRIVMLAAQRIWGRIINLSELHVKKDLSPWRDLVMERAGDAPLVIRGELPTSPSRVQWFLQFLSSHWKLKVFYIIDVQPVGRLEDYEHPQSTDFLRNSPRSIAVFHLPRVRFDIRAPWVANLRAISLWHPFRTSEILQVLVTIPRLEHATIHLWVPDLPFEQEISGQLIVLPHLTDLRLYHGMEEAAFLLQHLVPNTECEYNIHSVDTGFFHHPAEKWDVFSRCLQSRIDLQSETTLEFSIQKRRIDLMIASMPAFVHWHTIDRKTTQYQNNISTSLTRFSSRPSMFERVTSLVFHITDDDPPDLHQYSDSFTVFFSLFPSISTLQLSQRSIEFLADVYGSAEVPFPSLKNLELQAYDKIFDSRIETLLPRFLNQRCVGGKPIEALYVFPKAAKSDVRWSFLEEFQDLTVVWVPEA